MKQIFWVRESEQLGTVNVDTQYPALLFRWTTAGILSFHFSLFGIWLITVIPKLVSTEELLSLFQQMQNGNNNNDEVKQSTSESLIMSKDLMS